MHHDVLAAASHSDSVVIAPVAEGAAGLKHTSDVQNGPNQEKAPSYLGTLSVPGWDSNTGSGATFLHLFLSVKHAVINNPLDRK